ncbi:Uncharacterised protein [Mycobacteroides abscessus subsp. abscessus]|nr:Uncharacterised protein [Mycobacteroides abscessus subsp. abscessus]
MLVKRHALFNPCLPSLVSGKRFEGDASWCFSEQGTKYFKIDHPSGRWVRNCTHTVGSAFPEPLKSLSVLAFIGELSVVVAKLPLNDGH